jgi:hypothetical protein
VRCHCLANSICDVPSGSRKPPVPQPLGRCSARNPRTFCLNAYSSALKLKSILSSIPRFRSPGQAEHAFGDNVALNLRSAYFDRVDPRTQKFMMPAARLHAVGRSAHQWLARRKDLSIFFCAGQGLSRSGRVLPVSGETKPDLALCGRFPKTPFHRPVCSHSTWKPPPSAIPLAPAASQSSAACR